MAKTERASLEETLDFANQVRKAGGGRIIKKLIPSKPTASNGCLIANALNFSCEIRPNNGRWVMQLTGVTAIATAKKISDKLGLKYRGPKTPSQPSPYDVAEVVLPPRIAQVARDFDDAEDLFTQHNMSRSERRKQNAIEMWEYIEPRVRTRYKWTVNNGQIIPNPRRPLEF